MAFHGIGPRSLTLDRVAYESRYFLNNYVMEMFVADGIGDDEPAMEVLQRGQAPVELLPEHVREIKRTIRDIIDAQEKDEELNKKIARVPPGSELEVTRNVAWGLFQDGIFNWGRVMGLFYVAYRLCKNALTAVGSLINTIMDFMQENIINWIFSQGGWNGLLDFVRRSKIVNFVIFGGLAAITAAIIIYKNRQPEI